MTTKILRGKDGVIVDVDNIGANNGVAKGLECAFADGAGIYFGNEGTVHVGAIGDLKMNRVRGLGVERHGDVLELRKGVNVDVEIKIS